MVVLKQPTRVNSSGDRDRPRGAVGGRGGHTKEARATVSPEEPTNTELGPVAAEETSSDENAVGVPSRVNGRAELDAA